MQLSDFRMRPAPLMQVAPLSGIDGFVNSVNGRVAIKGFGDNITFFGWAIRFAAEVKAFVIHAFQHIRPFGSFEGNAICARKTRGDESDVP
ncbi:MAG: hypothetical protein A3J87_05940 [Sideroxydans sp. RIFOXYB12_FULL_59_6]|nr:MAG: hypothetical protein A3J87_05940 [Sideroxydans sp. RIFOXYB12_FULL_59_6]